MPPVHKRLHIHLDTTRGEPGESGHGGDAEGHGGLGFPALPGHGPALGRGRETHKNRDLTPGPEDGKVKEEAGR